MQYIICTYPAGKAVTPLQMLMDKDLGGYISRYKEKRGEKVGKSDNRKRLMERWLRA